MEVLLSLIVIFFLLFDRQLEIIGKKIVLNKGVYTDRELDSLIGTELKSQMLDSRDDVLRTNKLKKLQRWPLA